MQFALIGSGQQLVACANLLRARGHQIRGVISECPLVSAWARDLGVARIAPQDDQVTWLKREPYDWLLSIVNHAISSPELLATAGKGAINYHDSPLPAYAGFNATSWAIIDGQKTHGVTFHEMTSAVDGGRIYVQRTFEISDDDTAFTLGAKCTEEGVTAFAGLLEQLERGTLEGKPQEPSGSFHFRSDRPDIGALDFRRAVEDLHAFVRGLNFGPEDNWMCKPKLLLPGGFVAFTESRVDGARSGAPGTVLSISERGLDVAAADGVLCLSELYSVDGSALDGEALRSRFGVNEGSALPELDEATRAALQDFDGPVTKNERFWVKRLTERHAPSLSGSKAHAAAAQPGILKRTLPPALQAADAATRESALVAALAAYLTRVGDSGLFDLALHKTIPEALRSVYATATPLRVQVDPAAPFAALHAHVRVELESQASRRTYARDVALRYGSLRGRAAEPLPIGVRFDGALTLAEDTSITLAVAEHGSEYAFVFDEVALSSEAATALAERFEVLLVAALFDERSPVNILPLLPQAERSLLLHTWQDTARPYASTRCVHELFEEQVERTPEHTALVFRERSLSYRELNQRANFLAQHLRALGVGPDTLVGVCVERSLEMMVSLLGIQKAGGAYVPLDPAYPRERLAIMLEDSRARVLITQRKLAHKLPAHDSQVVYVDELAYSETPALANPASGVAPHHLAYVIFTSGSTGRPKGVMVEHRNVVNFFTGMDESIAGSQGGVWLAVTSISFDISVLELFYTLTRGFKVVIQEESDRASLASDRSIESTKASSTPMGFGLFYFAADSGSANAGSAYRLLIEGAKFADTHGFTAVWTPERHFHAFGGLYPNPSVTTAALATITSKVHLRAGSVVLPLHHPLRVAEDWAVIDHLSGGRVGLSFASGWHANDFAFFPEAYEKRREVMLEHIATVEKLWRGEKITVRNGTGELIEVMALPRPLQKKPPFWIASAGSVDTFKLAGRIGANVLTNMLGQDLQDLKAKFAAYRGARREHGHAGEGIVSVMLHTFVCEDTDRARELARKPFCDYLASSFDLVKVAPWMFPAFKQPSRAAAQDPTFNPASFTEEDMAALLEHAFDRYFDTAGLFGTPERALAMVEQLKSIGANEVACLVDFGIAQEQVLESLVHLDRLRQLSNPRAEATIELESGASGEQYTIAQQLRRHGVTHFQCTPSMARMLVSDEEALASLGPLHKLMLGGEALPTDLVEQLAPAVGGDIVNMYGPTETTIWSTTSNVSKTGEPITIGKPIANTIIRILDANRQLVPVGAPGELCIGGAGVVRGYLDRPELTAERFIEDPCAIGQRIYRTGDLARYRADGCIEFLGRLDHQVKVNGYRIELGEIESVLSRHPAVRQSVVVARSDAGHAELVGYLIPVGGDARASDKERVTQWQSLWDETYKLADGEPREGRSARFNIAGWNDSYRGEPIPAAEMREWLDATVQRIVSLAPKRVLEIGCGTGMILYGVLPHVEHYTAVDLSPHALETIRRELSPDENAKVTLLHQPAHALEGVAERSCDLVVINSVLQYFPDPEYLTRVLERASALVVDGGHIFVGDVRSLAHVNTFHTVVELHQSSAHESRGELQRRIARRRAQEGELLLDEGFFGALSRELPRLQAVSSELKRGRAHNEMSVFRYDVVLHVGPSAPAFVTPPPARAGVDQLETIRLALESSPDMLLVSDVPNARLAGPLAAERMLSGSADVRAEHLRELLERPSVACIEPEQLVALHPDYSVELRWASSGELGRLDALFRHRERGPRGIWRSAAQNAEGPLTRYANRPAKVADQDDLLRQLRAHLREVLPEYMVPAAFVVLDAFPLTPNGKIDRKALPAPKRKDAPASASYAAPTNELERQIAEVWREMLNVERVGLRDNIFDLGANSLLTVQANNRLSAVLGRKVSLVSMFRFPTVESLAAHLGDGKQEVVAQKRVQERADRRAEAAERRRQVRAERGTRGS